MNPLLATATILLFALLLGVIAKRLRVPEVTAYLLTGLVLGPSVFNLISHSTLEGMGIFSQIALGLILFSIGTVFDLTEFRKTGPRVLKLTLFEGIGAAVIVSLGLMVFGTRWELAVLLGSIAIETAAASTLMVLREYDSEGPLTDTLVPLIAINNLFCLTFFSLAITAIEISNSKGPLGSILASSTFDLCWLFLGGASLGLLAGYLLAFWAPLCSEHGETLTLIIGCILLLVGLAEALQTSALVATLVLGTTVTNLSQRTKRLFTALQKIDPPIYAIFFVVAGADLEPKSIVSAGVIGLLYFLLRLGGKVTGALLGARVLGMAKVVQRYLGVAIISQAGLAIGLMSIVRAKFPDIGATLTTIVLASILIYEIIGPFGTRHAIFQAKEAKMRPDVETAGLL
jgi:Kef-type K+ transport system membrane component KefB